ncbi:MAG: nitronate monooxygenase [bacterium]
MQVIGNEGAGHGSAVGSLVLVPTIRDAVSIPIIAAGGFGDGRGLVAALALGAGAVAMGTRFATAAESPLHPATLQRVLESRRKTPSTRTVSTAWTTGCYARRAPNASNASEAG